MELTKPISLDNDADAETPVVSLAEELAANGHIPKPEDPDFEPFTDEELKSKYSETQSEQDKNKDSGADGAATPEDEMNAAELGEMSLEEFSEAIVDVFDWLLSTGVKAALHKTAFNQQDREALSELQRIYVARKRDMGKELTEYETWLIDKSIELKEVEKNMPLTAEERERLIKRLKATAKLLSFKPTPQSALIITALMIVSVRALPVFGNILEKYSTKPHYSRSNYLDFEDSK
jgi:hypothetical protein